jgi:predicted phosphatase
MRVARTYSTNHLQHNNNNKNTINDETSLSFFPNGFPAVHGADRIRPHAKYHCQIFVFDRALQLWRPWSGTINDETSFSFFQTASRPFAALILFMWSDPIMIRPHAKYHCQILFFDRALQLWRPWSGTINDETSFSFFQTASQPFPALILYMWLDPIMIRPHAKYHCQILFFDRALQLRRPWYGSSGTKSVQPIRSDIHEYIFFPKSNTKKQTKIVSFYDF